MCVCPLQPNPPPAGTGVLEFLGKELDEKRPDPGSAFFSGEEGYITHHEKGFMVGARAWQLRQYPLKGRLSEVLAEADRLRRLTVPVWYKKTITGDLSVPQSWGYDKALAYLVLQVSPIRFQLLQQLEGLRSRIYNLDMVDDPHVELPLHEVRLVGPRGEGWTLHGAGHRTNSFVTITTPGWFGSFMGDHIAPLEYVPLIGGLVQGEGLLSRQQLPKVLGELWKEAITVNYSQEK